MVQLTVPTIICGSAQVEYVVKVPEPLEVKVTTPFGALAPAIPEESATVAVHDVLDPELTDVGLHEMVVVVGRRFTVMLVLPVLPEWLVSPPYVPGMFNAGPAKGGKMVIVHAAYDPVPERVQDRLADIDTIPAGEIAVPASVSDTVNVHVVGWPTVRVDGEQFIVTLVARVFTIIELLAPRLPEWTVSPG